MSAIRIRRHGAVLRPQHARVIIRPFIPENAEQIRAIISRALALTEEDVCEKLQAMHRDFASRHLGIEAKLLQQYARVRAHISAERPLSIAREQYIGALFSGEYALESAALFNPSIVPHPDQSDVPQGSLRFIMSLRATGEGHISSIEFRGGLVSADSAISFDDVSGFAMQPEVVLNPSYRKPTFTTKLREMGFENDAAKAVMEPLNDEFTRADLATSVVRARREIPRKTSDFRRTFECIQWLADSNYELRFQPNLALSERSIFPVSANESNGIEDARFVRFIDDDGLAMYYATYTAYNGREILPQLIETQDFLHFRVVTLNGNGVQNKGMALFPRRIDGRYAMLSRHDGENLYLMLSDNLHFWNDPRILLRPMQEWESVKIGNCGSPIETEKGWLVITHGVGPMRKYCIGAILLDLNDPMKVIGRLREPLISPRDNERDGYVPNVVYSCGALLHGRELILPYAMNDEATVIDIVSLDDLLAELR